MARFRRVHDDSPGWVDKKTKQLEQQITEVRGSRRLASSSVGGAGGSGTTTFRDSLSRVIATLGTQSDNSSVGAYFFRPDGSILANFTGTGPFGAFLALRDRYSNTLVSDDQFQGGLARPRLTMGQWVPNAAMGANPAAPVSSTYVTVETAEIVINAPYVRISVRASSSAVGATGNFQVLNSTGGVVVAPTAITPNTTSDYVRVPAAIPGFGTLGVVDTWRLQVNLTGAGTVGARGLSIIGSASYDTA